MAQESWPWPGTTTGDCGPYSDDDWDNMWEALYGSGIAPYNNRGIIRNWANELEVTIVEANTVQVDTGAALVHGKFYRNTVAFTINVPSSSDGHWREDLICLQRDRVAQTIRGVRHENPFEDADYPAPTQNDANIWEIPLAAVRIDSFGTITLITDLREYVSDLMQPKQIAVPFIPIPFIGVTYSTLGETAHASRIDAGIWCVFEFQIPQDFLELVEAYVVVTCQENNSVDWTLSAQGGGCGEVANRWSDSATADGQGLVSARLECLDVSTAFDGAGVNAGDIIGAELNLDVISGSAAYAFMLVFRYR